MPRTISPTVAGFLLALLVRLVLIVLAPWNFSFDGYQRWAGREHLLIQDWLPATQSVLWGVSSLGGGILATRIALAVVAAGAVAAGVSVARSMGGTAAGWFFVPLGLFTPFLVWSTVPYQEGTFLLLIFGAMAAALRDRFLLADLLVGAVALVRYEGWPFVVVYILWRRDPTALRALWGGGLWLTLKHGLDLTGYASSPTDFADWNGITERFSPATMSASLTKLAGQAWLTGGWLVVLLGGIGAVDAIRKRRRGAWVLVLLIAGQVAAVAGWLVGLETAIVRMQVVVGMLCGVFVATGAGRLWAEGRGRTPLVLLAVGASVAWSVTAVSLANRSIRSVRWEVELAETWAEHPERQWLVTPRSGLGTRSRHDGCEILQGLTERVHGRDFWCLPWTDDAPEGLWQAKWRKGGYRTSPPQNEETPDTLRP
ncbi:MAG: hypothetical protein ACI8RZ_004001 [Myxococcota bacterium]|jgi:hypothetical protein